MKAVLFLAILAELFIPAWIQADGYGYQWRVRSFKVRGRVVASYHVAGRGGQFIFVFPDQQMFAVFPGWNDNALGVQPFDMLQRYILPAATRPVPEGATTTRPH
jgi:hypothetical protein